MNPIVALIFQRARALLVAAIAFALAGCASQRSISNSGYADGNRCYPNAGTFRYNGELKEVDVLGIDPMKHISESEIADALANATPIRLRPGSTILLIQSGATYPDGPMVNELGQHVSVTPFSGVPSVPGSGSTRGEPYSKLLRLAAARAGAETVVCYWGMLESAEEEFATKTISWVPVVNWVVPDRKHHMRLRLKIALVDVRTGSWALFSPPPVEGKSMSTRAGREAVDQKQVEKLKAAAYTAAARQLVERFIAKR